MTLRGIFSQKLVGRLGWLCEATTSWLMPSLSIISIASATRLSDKVGLGSHGPSQFLCESRIARHR